MRELVCNGQLWARPGLRQVRSYKVEIARALSSNILVNTMDMIAAIQYILTAAQSLGSQVYYKRSQLTRIWLDSVLFCENKQA